MRRPAVAVGMLLLGACGGPAPASHTVEIRAFRFTPDTLRVAAGDTVVWVNRDVVPHTATAPGGPDSGDIPAGASGRWIAGGAGAKDYVCAYHPGMHGTVVVR